jgi:hypothetical protein
LRVTVASGAHEWYNLLVMPTQKRSPKSQTKSTPNLSPEYREYLKRHTELGEERPKLTQEEFERYEDELLDLLALDDKRMTDDEIVRIQELEFLMIDAE